MELRHFAEQVLFATTLEEKLRRPAATLTDGWPGAAFATPPTPGRPAALRFKPSGASPGEFPGLHRLEQESERGRLLHFFANHELLATELMALVLLKFPDAPAAFRRGVAQTLQDEQEHTRLYLQRMRECGLQFGEIPVSGYFWRAVSVMESPLDYVAGLSLTFEQANLDFARHFSRGFAAVGDNDSARLLDRIYRDEIAHVAHGLKWFRRWKNPGQSDWKAFCQQLKFPLSPQRAKGIVLNVEGRRAAGLDATFIAELDVYAQSKGRTPGVFIFNPFAEAYIAQGRSFTPVKHQAQLARDLANLPQFLGRQDDIVLVPERPAVEFLSGLKQAGFPLPEFVELDELCSRSAASLVSSETAGNRERNHDLRKAAPGAPEHQLSVRPVCHRQFLRGPNCQLQTGSTFMSGGILNLARRKLGRLRPWAWGPDSVDLLAPLFSSVTGETRDAHQCFNEKIALLYSKAWSAAFLRKVMAGRPADGGDDSWLCSEREAGVAVDTLEAALAVIATIRQRGQHKIVVKESLGLAGHNALRLWEPELLEPQRRWMERALQNGRQLVIEPWLERALDFSVQLEMTPGGLKLCGFTGLINDRKGQFLANWAAPNYARRLPASVAALFPGPADLAARLHRLYADIISRLEQELRHADYLGPLGIDAFVYRATEGGSRLKPVVEINPRYTMGRLTLELMKQTAPGRYGLFRLITRAQARKEGHEDFIAYARALKERRPLCLEGEPVPKIREGALCLNDPARAQVCLAVFQVRRTFDPAVAQETFEALFPDARGSIACP